MDSLEAIRRAQATRLVKEDGDELELAPGLPPADIEGLADEAANPGELAWANVPPCHPSRVAPFCLIISPILGVWAGGSMPNPPGNRPGAGQVAVGVAVPICLTFFASVVARTRRLTFSLATALL
jgi:hypothetical protein